ncbi:hypothetical protein Pla108_28680 [Botrimarina colliarenosi]|uniref:DUF1570 domain-containing protein n=1 Tax=Botrimarina colliarenosi TaxID=2528001 RepID=A0A5C6ADE9_9BACT|nr:DUF1570 domain-containing protein [Botrimarina colliarenosi]TWT97091.1 hypothetical protein Pla108_28680 [Botrimarina colliarenosi]
MTPAPNDGALGLAIPDNARPTPPRSEFAELEGRVVRVLAELGDERGVVLPTGELTVVPSDKTEPSSGPFRSATRDELVASLKAEGFDEYRFAPAGYYLFAYDCSDAYYLHTRSILESMLRGVVKQLAEWGLEPQRPETPLVVVITPNRAAFDAIMEMPEGVAAYYNGVSNRVVLYEDDRLFDAAPEFALKQGAYVVAHEAIHQLLHNTGIQGRLAAWPMWISEGVPEYFCPLRVHSSLARTDGDELPVRTVKWSEAGMVNDIRMHDLLRTKPAAGRLMRAVVSAPTLSARGYSVAWGLTHYLAERRTDEFKAYLADVRQQPALSMVNAAASRGPDPLFVKHFGDDFAALETEVQKHLTSRRMQSAYSDPYINQTHYVVSVTFKKGRVYYTQAGVSLSPASAREWTSEKRQELAKEGINAHVVTRECRDAREAQFQLRKILD